MSRRRLLKRSLLLSLGLILAVILGTLTALAALLFTEGGLRMALGLAQRFAPGELHWADARGQLVGPIAIEALSYHDGESRYRVASLDFDWAPGRLLARRLSVHRLHLQGVELHLPAGEDDPAEPIEPGWSLPLEIHLRDVAITDFSLRQGEAEPLVVESLHADLASGLEWIDVQRLQLQLPGQALQAQGRLGLGKDIATDLQLGLRLTAEGYAPLVSEGRLTGTWSALVLEQHLSQPQNADVRVELLEPFGELHWGLQLDLPVTQLQRIGAELPPLRLGGKVQGSGSLRSAELDADLQTDWEADDLYPLQVQLSLAEGDDGSLRLQPLQLTQGEARLRLSGGWHPDSGHMDLMLDAKAVQWPLQGPAEVRLPQAELRVNGPLADYRWRLQGGVRGTAFPAAHLSGTGQGSSEQLHIEQLALKTLDGVIDAVGKLAWAPQLQWQAELRARGIDPGRHWPDWPGRLNAQLHSDGAIQYTGVTASARIDSLDGALRDYPVAGQGRVEYAAERLQVQQVALRSGTAQLQVDGRVDTDWALQWSLQAPDLQQVVPTLAGRVNAQGQVTGARATPRLSGKAQLAEIVSGDMRLAQFDLQADLGLAPQAPLTLNGSGTDLTLGARRLDKVAVNLDGRLDAHRLHVAASGASHGLDLRAAGGWDGRRWQGRLQDSSWSLPETGRWTQRAPATLTLAADTRRSEPLCWQQQNAGLCLQLTETARTHDLELRLSDWPLAERAGQFLPPETSIEDSELSLQLRAQQARAGERALRAQLQAQVTSGRLAWQEGPRREHTDFGGIDASAELAARGLEAQVSLRLTGQDQLRLDAELPGYRPGVDPARQRLSGRLQGEVRDFALFEGLLGSLDQLQGVLRADAQLTGTLAAPQLDGELRLAEGRAFIGPAGVTLEALQLVLRGDPTSGQVRMEGSARSGPGSIRLEGAFTDLGTADIAGSLNIRGERFEAANLPEAWVLLTPEIDIQVAPQALTVMGSMTIPEARIAPRDFSGAVTPSKDVVLVNQEDEPPPAWKVTSRVKMIVGDKVHFDGFGLTARLTGALDVVDEPARVTLASGELRILDGEYTAYGQALKIDSGRILYRGGPIDNPALDIRAVRKTGEVLAGVKVYGDLQSPEMELFSTPSMPQADQLSYLLLGRPVQNASGSEGQLLFQAASSLGLKGGNRLAESLGSTFGLDELTVAGSGDDLDSAALVIGKYLSPRLYINYSVGLLDAVNKLQMRYELSRRWSLQTETGTATGADILYNYER